MTDGDKSPPAAEQTALSRELSDFLIQLSIGLHRYGMYPAGHPSLGPTVENLLDRLTGLLRDKSTLSLGVARTQLVIEGVATDPKNPVLSDLASRLHKHHVGAVTFRQGVGHGEIHEALRVLAVDPDHSGQPVGLDPEYEDQVWPHLRLFPLTYERLRIVGDEQDDESEESRSKRTRAAQLWVGLARAALAAEQAHEGETDENEEVDPTVVADAIHSHEREAAYDQVIVGYMLQIADELKAGKTPESGSLKRRISSMVSSLDSGTLGNLLEMGGDKSQRAQFLLSASEGMAVDAVVDLVKAASDTEHQTVSHSFMRMLSKLAQHAEQGSGRRRKEAETSVREQVSSLIRGWTLNDPNPDEYRQALQRMSTAAPVFAVSPHQQFLPEPQRLFQMSLELDITGDAIDQAVTTLVLEGKEKWIFDKLDEVNAPDASSFILERVANPEHIADLLAGEPLDINLLDRHLKHVGLDAANVMLDALITSESSHTRRVLISRLVALGPELGSYLVARLDDERWFVRRNMLALLSELPSLPDGLDAMNFVDDPDGRVRREVLRIVLREETHRERAICVALSDSDDHNVRLALTAAARDCPEAAIPLLVSRATSGTNRDQRITAIRILAGTGAPQAITALLQIATPRKGLLGLKTPPKSPEYLAALANLVRYGDDERVRNVLALAARSRDREIARAAIGELDDDTDA